MAADVTKVPHRLRFSLVYGLLAAALVAAVAGVVVYAGRSINPAPVWSSWKPHGAGLGAAKEIAQHVGAAYHLPGGAQLDDVIANSPSVSSSTQTVPIHYVALTGANGSPNTIVQVSGSDSIMYSLCGLGASCSIATGTPSQARGTLVRREILELALYTFKYASGVKNVIAFIPPRTAKAPQYVVYLQKSDVSTELKVPLDRTLGEKVPLPDAISATDARSIESTTGQRIYQLKTVQPTQTGDWVLVLAPLAA